jgi:hypothetical protein
MNKLLQKHLDKFVVSHKPMFDDLREIEALCERFEIMWGIRIQTSIAKQPDNKGGRMLSADKVEELFDAQEFTNKPLTTNKE